MGAIIRTIVVWILLEKTKIGEWILTQLQRIYDKYIKPYLL